MGMVGIHSAITTYWKGTFSMQFNHYPLHLILGPNYGMYCPQIPWSGQKAFATHISHRSRLQILCMSNGHLKPFNRDKIASWRYCFAPMDPWQAAQGPHGLQQIPSTRLLPGEKSLHTAIQLLAITPYLHLKIIPSWNQTSHKPTIQPKHDWWRCFRLAEIQQETWWFHVLFEQKILVKSSHESETTTIFTLLLTLSPSAVRESYEWRWQGRDCLGVLQACGALITHLIWRLIGFATVHVINNNSLFGSRIPNHDFSIFWALGQQQCIEPKHENMLSMLYGEAVMDRKPPRKTYGQKLARFWQTLHYHHLSGL